MDLRRWAVTGLRLPDFDLHDFWADGDLRLVLYEASDDAHAFDENTYYFAFQFSHASNRPVLVKHPRTTALSRTLSI